MIRPTIRSNGFRLCPSCDGAGFTRSGVFGSHIFPRCPTCGGCGQIYVDPPPPPPPNREAASIPGGWMEF